MRKSQAAAIFFYSYRFRLFMLPTIQAVLYCCAVCTVDLLNGRCENPESAVFSRLFAPVRIENAVKIRVRKSPPISPSSNGFSEKPIRIIDRTERFFAPKSRFWQCVKSTGYAEPHQKLCRQMLCEEREKQDLYRRMFKGSYNRKYDDYMLGLPLSAQYKSSTIS